MEKIKIPKIKDIKEFEKLFKIHIPYYKEFEYYINLSLCSNEYDFLPELLQEFAEFEAFIETDPWIIERGYKTIGDYKMAHALPTLNHAIGSSNAYQEFTEGNYKKKFSAIRTKNTINSEDHSKNVYISIDFKSANFNVLKLFDKSADNELGDTWEQFCGKLSIHPTLAKSKSFRQLVFGKMNPKRSQAISHDRILMLLSNILEDTKTFTEDDVVFVSHDEIIFKVNLEYVDNSGEVIQKTKLLKSCCLNNGVSMPIRIKAFLQKPLDKGIMLKTMIPLAEKDKLYCTLCNVPGNQFYMYFKKYIVNLELEDRDLLFWNDGKLAKWIIENE